MHFQARAMRTLQHELERIERQRLLREQRWAWLVTALVIRVASSTHLHDERVESAGFCPVDGRNDAGWRTETAALYPECPNFGRGLLSEEGGAGERDERQGPANGPPEGGHYVPSSAGSRCSSSRSRGSMSSPIASRTESCALRRRAIDCV